MADTLQTILGNTNNSGYTVTQSQLEAAEVNEEARKKAEEAKKKTGGKQSLSFVDNGSTDFNPNDVQKPKKMSTIDEKMAQWKKQNPEPVRKTVEAPDYTQTFNYQDILNQYQKLDEVPEKESKSQKWNERIGAIGDALTALINAGGVSDGGNNMELDPARGLAENIRKRYEETRDKQKGDREKYLQLMLKAAQLEDSNNMKKLSMYNTAQQKADSDYNQKVNAWNRAYDQAADGYRYEEKLANDKAKAEEDARQKEEDRKVRDKHNKTMEGLTGARLTEQKRHNREIENNNSGGGGNNGSGQQFGDYKANKKKDAQELKNIVEEMRKAGCYDERTARKVEKSKYSEGTAIQMALDGAKSRTAAQILQKHGFRNINN